MSKYVLIDNYLVLLVQCLIINRENHKKKALPYILIKYIEAI